MTVEQAIAKAPRPLILHRGQVSFNTREARVAAEWKAEGALVRPWYDDDEMALAASNKLRAHPLQQGYEVGLLGVVSPRIMAPQIGMGSSSPSEDITAQVLTELARRAMA